MTRLALWPLARARRGADRLAVPTPTQQGIVINHAHDRTSGDVLSALRLATADRHTLLDTGLPLGGAHPTLGDYGDHLRMLRAWLAPLEAWLAGFHDGPQAALAPVQRLALIDDDLAHPLIAPARAQAALQQAWPQHASAAYRWGVCYVVEGSQLGGAVLHQKLAAQLAPHPLRYLRPDGAGPGPRWRQFMLALKEGVRSEGEIADACRGACDAFDRILALRPAN